MLKIEIVPYTSGEALLFDWGNTGRQADAVYLDIHMQGVNGMQAAKELRNMGCKKEIVFLARDKQPVFDAFDVKAFHYVVKDYTTERKFEDIRYFQVDVRVVTVYYGKSDSFGFYSTMGKLDNLLYRVT